LNAALNLLLLTNVAESAAMYRSSQEVTMKVHPRIAAVVLLLAVSNLGIAQQTTATLLGTVTDSSGATVAGVVIKTANVATNALRETITDRSGSYSVPNLPPGSYRVSATKEGFQTQ